MPRPSTAPGLGPRLLDELLHSSNETKPLEVPEVPAAPAEEAAPRLEAPPAVAAAKAPMAADPAFAAAQVLQWARSEQTTRYMDHPVVVRTSYSYMGDSLPYAVTRFRRPGAAEAGSTDSRFTLKSESFED